MTVVPLPFYYDPIRQNFKNSMGVAGQESVSVQICCGIIIFNSIIVKRTQKKYLHFINSVID